jgi:hypothetical protein
MVFSASAARRISASFMCLLLSGCYDPDPMPVADIGRGGSIATPLVPVRGNSREMGYPTLEGPVGQLERNQSQNLRSADPMEAPQSAAAAVETAAIAPPSTEDQQATAEPSQGDGEVDMDKMFGFSGSSGSPANSDRQTPQIAEGDVDAPVVDGVGTGELRDVSKSRRVPAEAVIEQPKPVQGQKVAYIPRLNNPMSAPESQGGVPVSERSCRQLLQRLNVGYTDVASINGGANCGIDYPLQLQSINGVRIQPAATLNCAMALTFARWVRDDLVPTTRVRYFSGVNTIRQLSSYSCRPMNSKPGNPWSEHARGNAIDVGKIVLNNGDEIDVRKPGFFSFRQKGLLNSVRADSCKYFNTVLGPGDPYHGDHFHFDLRSRKSGRRYCSLD